LRRLNVGKPVLEGAAEVQLGQRDIPWLAGAVFCGSIVGPLLLMIKLMLTEAATASLLLTLEVRRARHQAETPSRAVNTAPQ
jgi:hypothetical protein